MSLLKAAAHRLGRAYIRRICRDEYAGQKFTNHNERTIEYRFALEALSRFRPKTVLDVGSGTTAWPHLLRNCGYVVTAIDNVRDYWPSGMVNRHWHVLDENIVSPNGALRAQTFGAITCISVIEHIENHEEAVRQMARLLEPGGILILTTPYSHSNPHPNVYKHPEALYGTNAPYICRSSSAPELRQWCGAGFTLERAEYWRLFTGPVWATGERTAWERREEHEPHQLGCFVLQRQR